MALKILKINSNPKKRKVIRKRKKIKSRKRQVAAPKKKRRTKIIRVKKNRARIEPQRSIIAGIFNPRKGFGKTVYFTGESFSLNRGKAKTFSSDGAKSEAKRILPMLPPKIDRIWTQAA